MCCRFNFTKIIKDSHFPNLSSGSFPTISCPPLSSAYRSPLSTAHLCLPLTSAYRSPLPTALLCLPLTSVHRSPLPFLNVFPPITILSPASSSSYFHPLFISASFTCYLQDFLADIGPGTGPGSACATVDRGRPRFQSGGRPRPMPSDSSQWHICGPTLVSACRYHLPASSAV
jgi:hypothetical protein